MKKILLLIAFIFSALLVCFGQNFTISGNIYDSLSNENMVDATIVNLSNSKAIKSNEYGYYSITLPKGTYKFLFTYTGYENKIIELDLSQNIQLNVLLNRQNIEIQQIVIKGNQQKTNVNDLPIARIQIMPSLGGETDVIKSLVLMPGVSAGTEGSAGLNVRGGSPDQNLFLLDDVPVYNANHVFGFVSVFNTDAIKSVKLYKGGIPAQYTGRSSAVVDMYMKEGDLQHLHGDVSIGIISSKILLEGPVKKDKASFLVTARRSYIDLLFRPFSKSIADNTITGLYFYDFNAKINYKINNNNRLFLSFYSGYDKFHIKYDEVTKDSLSLINKSSQNIAWGNITGSLRWVSVLGNKISLNSSLFLTQFSYLSDNYQLNENYVEGQKIKKEYNYKIGSNITEIGFRSKLDYFLNTQNHIKLGFSCSKMLFTPNFASENYNDEFTDLNRSFESSFDKINALTYTTFVEDEIKFGKVGANIGLNYNGFFVNNKLSDYVEPRVSLWLQPIDAMCFEVSFTNIHQSLHLLTNSTIGLPTDLWLPSTERIKPINSNIYDAGLTINISRNLSLSLSGFYKTFDNLIQYRQGVDFLDVSTDWQDKVTVGKGWSYGVELALQKAMGKFSWQLAYTYSRSFRLFADLNMGETFPFKYDRPHNFNAQFEYHLKPNILLTANWVVMSGQMATFATQFFLSNDGYTRPVIEHLNNLRFPLYHRLDIGVNITKQRPKTLRIWSFGLYNAYNRLNPMYMEQYSEPNKLIGVSFLPIMPFFSYSVKF